MYEVLTLNKIAKCGLDNLDKDLFTVTDEVKNPDAIILRSFKMHDMELPESLMCVASGFLTSSVTVNKSLSKLSRPHFAILFKVNTSYIGFSSICGTGIPQLFVFCFKLFHKVNKSLNTLNWHCIIDACSHSAN